jgi:hypothetical protein
MSQGADKPARRSCRGPSLQPGVHYYVDAYGRMVFTAKYLLDRGYCCKSGCRHCPYGFVRPADDAMPPEDDAAPTKDSRNAASDKP